jgi:hypothetical protein
MSVEHALLHAERNRWRKLRPPSLMAELVLADEVLRLRDLVRTNMGPAA